MADRQRVRLVGAVVLALMATGLSPSTALGLPLAGTQESPPTEVPVAAEPDEVPPVVEEPPADPAAVPEPPADLGAGESITEPTPGDATFGEIVETDGTDPATAGDPNAPEGEEPKPARRGAYASQPPFAPEPILVTEIHRVQSEMAEVDDALAETTAKIEEAREQQAEYTRKLTALRVRIDNTEDRVEEAQEVLGQRAIAGFVANDVAESAAALAGEAIEYDAIMELETRELLLSAVVEADGDDLETLEKNLARYQSDLPQLKNGAERVSRSIDGFIQRAAELEQERDQLAFELDVWKAGSADFVAELRFPILWPYDLPLINSYGFARAPGTIDEHWHEGIDLFAPVGTPLIASEGGVITKIGNGRLGGLTVTFMGDSGNRWYYAHLHTFAPNLAVGQRLGVGDPLGTVGKSGNAQFTPAHLHLEIRPNGGRPINPYPMLKVASDREIAERLNPDAQEPSEG